MSVMQRFRRGGVPNERPWSDLAINFGSVRRRMVPSVDLQPVVIDMTLYVKCNNCGHKFVFTGFSLTFCEKCGADNLTVNTSKSE